jgi:hypothetical protein
MQQIDEKRFLFFGLQAAALQRNFNPRRHRFGAVFRPFW